MNAEEIAAAVLAGVEALLEKRLAPILGRLEGVEARAVPAAEDVSAQAVATILGGDGIKSLIDLQVAEYMAENPPEKGDKGDPGKDGLDGQKGADGLDGVGMAGAMIDRDGELLLTTTKGDVIRLGSVVGKDGLGFDDMGVETDGQGGVTLKFIRGAQSKEFALSFGVPVYRGYWRQNTQAKAGHVLTHKGNAWIAVKDTDTEPSREAKDTWQILAAKGSDGRDGRDGRDLGPAPAIKLEAARGS